MLRPTVAVAVYIAFEALALHDHPKCREKLRAAGNETYVEWFVQEVRRFHPFFPAVAAIVRRDFSWKGYAFPRGRRALLDLYGTNRDPRTRESPDTFRPERFAFAPAHPFAFVPQGGGDHSLGHRCVGEWVTAELMKRAARFLAGGIHYDVPPQNLRVDMQRLPALPASGFVFAKVRRRYSKPKLVGTAA